jgi:RNA polymerase sigma-70 factor (ECF subfamily)
MAGPPHIFSSRTPGELATDDPRPRNEDASSNREVHAAEVSYDAIYKEHFGFVWRNVRRLGVPVALADDAVQDVFIVVHRRLPTFEWRSSIRTWLFGILAHVARDYRRSQARQDTKAQALAAEGDPDAPATPAELADRSEAARILDGFVARIDEDKREVFVLVELEQMSVADIAEALGLNVNTAHARLRAARQQFEAAVARFRARERT